MYDDVCDVALKRLEECSSSDKLRSVIAALLCILDDDTRQTGRAQSQGQPTTQCLSVCLSVLVIKCVFHDGERTDVVCVLMRCGHDVDVMSFQTARRQTTCLTVIIDQFHQSSTAQ